MSTTMWESMLQGVTPNTGGGLPTGTYRLRPVSGEAKANSGGGISMSIGMEVISGPLAGRKAYHFENFPTDNSDSAKQRMGYIVGMIEAFGLPQAQLSQMMAGQPMTVETVDYLAKYLVQLGRQVKATTRPRRDDHSRTQWSGFMPDDGIEPEPPAQAKTSAPNGAPGFPGGQPQFGGAPGGAPQGIPGQPPQGSAMPLGGFPGSGGAVPNQAPDWAQQPAAAPQGQPQQFGQQPAAQQFSGPGQMAPAAQPQAAGMSQSQQPQAAQFPQQSTEQPQPNLQQGFPGQQFPGQVDPANFPPQGQQPQAGPGQLPGAQPQQPQAGPAGLPQGGFPQGGQAPQATF